MKKKSAALAVLAAIMVSSAAVGSAWAYFTTYAQAGGGYAIRLGDETSIHEEFSNWTKRVTITNQEGSQPVYVRALAFCGSAYARDYSSGSGKWTLQEDGYYHYSDILEAGQTTDELLVRISGVPETVEDGENFNVAVVYETTPVCYGEDGTPYENWEQKVTQKSAEGGE